LKALEATTEERLGVIIADMSESAMSYILKVLRKEQFMVAAGKMYGHKTSSMVEGMNNGNVPARGMHLYASLLKILQDSQRRYNKNQGEAQACLLQMSKWMDKKMHDEEVSSRLYTHIHITSVSDNLQARVQSVRDPSISYNTDLKALTCDCGKVAITGRPCPHLVCHASKFGLPLYKFMDVKDTTAGWKKQYPAGLSFEVPSEAQVVAHDKFPTAIKLPPVLRRGKGRPKLEKRKKGHYERGGKKREVTCGECGRKGHTRKGGCNNA
jgi:hypothetical protein